MRNLNETNREHATERALNGTGHKQGEMLSGYFVTAERERTRAAGASRPATFQGMSQGDEPSEFLDQL